MSSVHVSVFENDIKQTNNPVFDVRKDSEFQSERMLVAQNSPLDYINEHLQDFPQKELFYIHCAGGYRSVIAGSILKKRGIHNFVNIEGGFKAIKETSLACTDYICPSTR